MHFTYEISVVICVFNEERNIKPLIERINETLDQFSFDALREKHQYLSKNYDSLRSRLIKKRDQYRNEIHREMAVIKEVLQNKKVGEGYARA